MAPFPVPVDLGEDAITGNTDAMATIADRVEEEA
jgi:hypothetical protein